MRGSFLPPEYLLHEAFPLTVSERVDVWAMGFAENVDQQAYRSYSSQRSHRTNQESLGNFERRADSRYIHIRLIQMEEGY